jgi:hypothetical protein
MEDKQPTFQIKLVVKPNGSVRTALETEDGKTPVQGLIFYYKLEPEIVKFKKLVQRAISAHYGQGKKHTGDQSGQIRGE